MKIRTHYVTNIALLGFVDAISLCKEASKLGIRYNVPHRNDGKPIFMEYPNCMGELDWSYRINSSDGIWEASRITKFPLKCRTEISLDSGDPSGYFDIIEHTQANYLTIVQSMRTNHSYQTQLNTIIKKFPQYAEKELLRDGYNDIKIIWPFQAKIPNIELPSLYKYQGGVRGVCFVRARDKEGLFFYSAQYIIYHPDIDMFSFDFISSGWSYSLYDCAMSALEYFYNIGQYAEFNDTKFWNHKGALLKFKNVSDVGNPRRMNDAGANYEVGDKVKVKPLSWYNKHKDRYGTIEFEDADGDFSELMSEYCGKTMTITAVYCDGQYELDGVKFWWPEWCFDKCIKQESDDTNSHQRYRAEQKTYLMRDTHLGYTKIGKSFAPKARERTLLGQKPTIELFAVCNKDIEKTLHKEFAHKRIRGEWFDLSDEDIIHICRNYNFKKYDSEKV